MCNGGTRVMEKVESFYKEYEIVAGVTEAFYVLASTELLLPHNSWMGH